MAQRETKALAFSNVKFCSQHKIEKEPSTYFSWRPSRWVFPLDGSVWKAHGATSVDNGFAFAIDGQIRQRLPIMQQKETHFGATIQRIDSNKDAWFGMILGGMWGGVKAISFVEFSNSDAITRIEGTDVSKDPISIEGELVYLEIRVRVGEEKLTQWFINGEKVYEINQLRYWPFFDLLKLEGENIKVTDIFMDIIREPVDINTMSSQKHYKTTNMKPATYSGNTITVEDRFLISDLFPVKSADAFIKLTTREGEPIGNMHVYLYGVGDYTSIGADGLNFNISTTIQSRILMPLIYVWSHGDGFTMELELSNIEYYSEEDYMACLKTN